MDWRPQEVKQMKNECFLRKVLLLVKYTQQAIISKQVKHYRMARTGHFIHLSLP